jgi:aminopeptidase YwaD
MQWDEVQDKKHRRFFRLVIFFQPLLGLIDTNAEDSLSKSVLIPMRIIRHRNPFVAFALALAFFTGPIPAQEPLAAPAKSQPGTAHAATTVPPAVPKLCAACILAHMEFLASDAMRGRGSGTADELLAATYVGSELRAYGITPAGDDGGFLQRAVLKQVKLTAAPVLTIAKGQTADTEEKIVWTYGKEFVALHLSQTQFSGPLRVVHPDSADAADSSVSGAVVLVLGGNRREQRARAEAVASAGAVGAIISASAEEAGRFPQKSEHLPALSPQVEGQTTAGLETNLNLLQVSPDALKTLEALPAKTKVMLDSVSTSEKKYTWNAVGILRGRDPRLRDSAVLLSAHLDHLGIGRPVNGDDIYNGADDDASGTTAVLELARILGAGPRPRRTVIFALFGSEETGGQGSTYFREHPPLPLREIAVNLEFEMLGRADPAVRSDTVWLTGWERSNLGPTLAARGGNLVSDPHPEQNFFARSDNYVLAKKGVVAQTVSSYGLHADYHQPSDDLAHIDFNHMNAAIGSLLRPISWLVNSSFRPKWDEGEEP